MKGKKSLIFMFLFVVVLGLSAVLYIYNKPHINVKESRADYVLTAQNLIDEYRQNEGETDEKYSEHVIQVKGRVFDISTLKGNSVITLKDNGSESSIICHMQPGENKKALEIKKGSNVEIKGICTGYLLDVIMVRCTLVE